MNILHIAPSAPYNEGWGYQENLLPKYQSKLGHKVSLIVTDQSFINGQLAQVDIEDYVSDSGFRVIRRQRKRCLSKKITSLMSKIYVYDLLLEINPDIVFCHGLSNLTIFQVVKYKKKVNKNLVIVEDNHADYNIGAKVDSFKRRLIRSFWRYINRKTIKYVSKVYGVTPWRKTYAEDYYGIPSEKTDVLIMGADDEKIDFANRESIRASKRSEYGIKDEDFLIVTGGKIDKKKKIDVLMKACAGIENVKLIVFGNVLDDVKQEFETILKKSDNIIYIGWVAADKVYDYFFAADLVLFPGQHSVLWEQACASKVPCVFERWEGMDHVNNGGNSDFVSPVTEEVLRNKIIELKYTDKYFNMKLIAESSATDAYLYSNIAKKSLECLNRNFDV